MSIFRSVLAPATSTLLAVLGAVVIARHLNPLAGDEPGDGLAALLPDDVVGPALLTLGLLGLLSVVVRRGDRLRLATILVGVQTALLGVLLVNTHLIALLGYLLAAFVPLGAITLGVLAVRRYRWVRWLVATLIIAAASWGAVTGVLAWTNVASTFGSVARATAAQSLPLLAQAVLVTAFLAAADVVLGRVVDDVRRGTIEAWLLRHRLLLTFVAAAGPLPYFLLRMTWLTPWPLGAPGGLDPATRLWGLLLGTAALVGAILTVGLVRPWGRVAPRWMPGAAGRPVPVAAAVVPALTVAVALTAAAVPMALSMLGRSDVIMAERVLYLLVFPFGLWGPALALAAWAYALSRRTETVPAAPIRPEVLTG